jgi:orotate phosphoribosyltransferase
MPIYNDNRMFLGNWQHRQLISEGFAALIAENQLEVEVVGGTSTAGISPGTTLADRLKRPFIYIRDKKKGHGLENRVEGILLPKQRVLVIEDVVSTGGSSVSAVEGVRESGGSVGECLCIYSYGFEKALSLFREANCALYSLLTLETLFEVAVSERYISPEEQKELESWRADPFGWGATRGFESPGT